MIIVRPSYSDSTDHTFGKTLLTPYKMILEDKNSSKYSLKYLKTTEFKIHLLGNTYRVNAFPFSSQDGVALKCAETAIYVLCEYAAAHSSLYRRILPSDIQNKLRERLPERILPSRGLYCNDISYLLREFGFSPMIYASAEKLARHVFLEASSAVSICDTFITEENDMVAEAIDYIIAECRKQISQAEDDETEEQYTVLIDALTVSEDNPVTIRYYLVNSTEYKQYRIANSATQTDKVFYADIPMPKAVWIAEISTYKCYEMGYGFGEVVLDATASNQSKVNSVLLIKMAHLGVYRLPNETYNDFKNKIKKCTHYMNLSSMFVLFSNFISPEWDEEDE